MSESIARITFEQEAQQAEIHTKEVLNKLVRFAGRTTLALSLTFGATTGIFVGEAIVGETPEAEAVSDDYPDRDAYFCGSYPGRPYDWCKNGNMTSSRYYDYRNCTDWAAWRVRQITGKRVPGALGNATTWDDRAGQHGAEVDAKPEVGDVAVWDGTWGHVAVVETINSDGSVNISEYNKQGNGKFGTRNNVRAHAYIDFTPGVNEGIQNRPDTATGNQAKRSDFNGNGNSDLLLYKPGGADYVWQGHDKMGEFGEHRLYIGEDFKIAVGDFNGNGRADYVTYGLGTAPDYILYGQEEPGEFKKVPLQIDGFYNQVLPGDYDGDGFDDLMLYAEGGEDRVWYGTPNAARFDKHSLNVQLGGGYQITSGAYNNNRNGDLFLYNPRGEDFVLSGQDRRGGYAFTKHRVNAQQDIPFARPVSGDFNGDGHDDVFMHGPNETPDYVLYGLATSGDFHRSQIELNKDYTPIATGDYNGDGKDDVYLQSPQADRNQLLSGTKEKGNFTGYMKSPGVTYQPIST